MKTELIGTMNGSMSGSSSKAEMGPIQQGERILILDVLRGFAVFGILVVNIAGFAGPAFWPGYVAPASPWYDTLASGLVKLLAEAKFYTIFSFLFGLGFSVQLGRAAAKGVDIRSFYPRRLWILFGIGILHGVLLWTGDILRLYALLGFALLAFRKRSNRALLAWMGVFFALSFAMLTLFNGQTGSGTQGIPGLDLPEMARTAYTSPSYVNVVLFQVFASVVTFLFTALTQGPSVMALFLAGLLAGRLQVFERLGQLRTVAKYVLVWGALIGLAANGMLVFAGAAWQASLGLTLGAPALAGAYIAGLALLSLRPRGSRLLAPLGQVGRMALTNYVLQSVVCSFLFYGFGLGLYERVGGAGLVGISLLVYLAQVAFSHWWLGRFRYGPLEWLWRSLTYGKRQPFARQPRVDGRPEELATPAV